MLDFPRVKQLFGEVAELPPQAIIDRLAEAAEGWRGGSPQNDDITFVVLKVSRPSRRDGAG